MIRTVVFDFDGTLVDSNQIKQEGFYVLARQRPGGEALIRQLLDRIKGDRRSVLTAYESACRGMPVGPQDDAVSELVEAYSELTDSAVSLAPEIPGATLLLDFLRNSGRKTVLSSATPRANMLTILARRKWVNWFDYIGGHPTTKVETLHRVMSKYNLSSGELLVVGDGADDMTSADSVGCSFFPVGAARGVSSGKRVYDLHEIRQILDSVSAAKT